MYLINSSSLPSLNGATTLTLVNPLLDKEHVDLPDSITTLKVVNCNRTLIFYSRKLEEGWLDGDVCLMSLNKCKIYIDNANESNVRLDLAKGSEVYKLTYPGPKSVRILTPEGVAYISPNRSTWSKTGLDETALMSSKSLVWKNEVANVQCCFLRDVKWWGSSDEELPETSNYEKCGCGLERCLVWKAIDIANTIASFRPTLFPVS